MLACPRSKSAINARINSFFLIFLSFAIVAFGQGTWISGLGVLAATVGLALFWKALLLFAERRRRFWVSVFWFACVQMVQLSWLSEIAYMGPLILVVYLFLAFALGLQFGILSLFLSPEKPLPVTGALSMAGAWVFLEWMRLFPLTGFTWNPLGLALVDSPHSIQFAAFFGVYGLSFWVVFVNALALRAAFLQKGAVLWGVCALFPYFLGWGYQEWMGKKVPAERHLKIALVQTALLPEQRELFLDKREAFIPLLDQWERVWNFLQRDRPVDCIVLPEGAFSFGAFRPVYSFSLVRRVWQDRYGEEAVGALPPLRPPLAVWRRGKWKVTNAFLVQAMANYFRADVFAGLDDVEGEKKYNAAFHFRPRAPLPQRYEKRILVPVGEYIPFSSQGWVARFLAEQFAIGDSFHPGQEAKVFFSSVPIGVSICAEETYSSLIRDLRRKGARLFVNLTNDVWFPRSRLPHCHFQHARMRAVENGVFVLRACNTGVTGVIDSFGRALALFPVSEKEGGALYFSFPVRSFSTLYTWWGDAAILLLSFLFLLVEFWKKLLLNSSLR